MQDYVRHAETLSQKLVDRGYPRKLVKRAYKRAKYYNRDAFFTEQSAAQKNNTLPLTFVTNFSTVSNQVKNIINRNWHLISNLGTSKLLKPMF